MKAIIKRPFQRQLLVVLSLTIFSGCSGIQSNAAYKHWEKRAYKAYNVATPVHKTGILPALFKTVSIPGQHLLKKPVAQRVIYPKASAPAVKIKNNELHYIEQHYGI